MKNNNLVKQPVKKSLNNHNYLYKMEVNNKADSKTIAIWMQLFPFLQDLFKVFAVIIRDFELAILIWTPEFCWRQHFAIDLLTFEQHPLA